MDQLPINLSAQLKKIEGATNGLNAIVDIFEERVLALKTLEEEITSKETQLQEMEATAMADLDAKKQAFFTEFDRKKEAMEYKLRIQKRDQSLESAQQIASEYGKVLMDAEDANNLVEEVKAYSESTELQVETAVAEIEAKMKRRMEAALKSQKADFEVARANDAAQIVALQDKVEWLTGALRDSKEEIAKARQLTEKVAEAASKGAVSVNTGK